MNTDAVRGSGPEPLLTRFAVLCALLVTSAASVAASMVWPVFWLRPAALLLAAGALVAGALVFSDARRRRESLESLHRELELIGQQPLPERVADAVAGRNADGTVLRLPAVLDERLAGLAANVERICADAVRLAQDHAEIRAGYAEVFVNMFRRTQTLLLRQLQIIEGLERDNRSPSDLNRFYQLDHLVMRMRRNNENILVLSGTELVRKTKEPVPVEDLLRASISEIDSYQRVRLLSTPSVRVSNTAAGDLIRIVAELLDNATSFSPPDKPVTVKAELARHHGLSIGVIDNGIGMSDDDIRDTNEQLRKLGSAEIARSRRLGLLVVGRLAGRHGFRVELFGGDDVEGVSALVSVPSSALVNEDAVRATLPGDVGRDPAGGLRRPGPRTVRAGGSARFTGRGHPVVPVTTTVRRQDVPVPEGAQARRPSAWHERKKVSAPRQPGTGLSSTELVAQAHSDVPGELPTRVPNRPAAPAGTTPPSAPRTASRWFEARSRTRLREHEPAGKSGTARNWRSTADRAWEMVEKSQNEQDHTYTEDGLPLRKKGEHLFAGHAEGDPATERAQAPKPIERDATQTRRRLSSYQQGVQKAKEQEARLRGTGHSGGWTILEIEK